MIGADYDLIRKALRSVSSRIGPDLWVKVNAGGTEAEVVSDLESELDDVLANYQVSNAMAVPEPAVPHELQTALAAKTRMQRGVELGRNVRLRPPPRLTLSEWADRTRQLSDKASAEPGRWSLIQRLSDRR